MTAEVEIETCQGEPAPLEGEPSGEVHPDYIDSLKTGLIGQVLFGGLTALTLDGGTLFRIFLGGVLVQCVALLMMLSRRPLSPTKLDLCYVRFGICLYFAAILLVYELGRSLLFEK